MALFLPGHFLLFGHKFEPRGPQALFQIPDFTLHILTGRYLSKCEACMPLASWRKRPRALLLGPVYRTMVLWRNANVLLRFNLSFAWKWCFSHKLSKKDSRGTLVWDTVSLLLWKQWARVFRENTDIMLHFAHAHFSFIVVWPCATGQKQQ